MAESDGVIPKLIHDETDVAFALARTTYDGKGDEEPGPGDFEGFPAEDVEKKE